MRGFEWFRTDEGRDLIRKGWKISGLQQGFNSVYQRSALRRMYKDMYSNDEARVAAWEQFNEQELEKSEVSDDSWRRWNEEPHPQRG